ncbi:MAG: Fe-Mn family superoxide dismutase [Patescibacteria group bacterium]
MAYQPASFEYLLHIPGFSADMMSAHITLYQGYVTNTNKLLEQLYETEKNSPQYNELKRRFGWEFNGMRLHEFYFGNMSANPGHLSDTKNLQQFIQSEFGSIEDFEKDFRATAAMRGIGWVILAHDATSNRLFVTWINEHDAGHLAGANPIAVMDVFEHAYIKDYGIKRADYIDACWRTFDWSVVESRLQRP